MEFSKGMDLNGTDTRRNWFGYLLLSVIIAGIILSLFNLLHNRSLWMDEAMVALNIVNKSYGELLQPLDMNQVAPIGFLFGEKMLINIFGSSDLALRILPFLSYVCAILLFFWLNRRIFSSSRIALFAVAIFCLNLTIISYSSEVKQYSTDIFVAILIAFFAVKYGGNIERRSIAVYSVAGILAIWFSNIAVIMLFVAGLYSLHTGYLRSPKKAALNFIPIIFWVISFGVYYGQFIHNHPAKDAMMYYWGKAFLPQDILSTDFYAFLFSQVKMLFGTIVSFEMLWPLVLVPSIAGIWWFVRSGRAMYLYLILMPVFVHLGLSYFEMYPFSTRLTLYILPFLIVLFAMGLWRMYVTFNERVTKVPIYALLVPVLFLFYPLSRNLPIEKEEIKKSLGYLEANIKNGDMVYLYYGSIPAFRFYKPNYPTLANTTNIIVSSNSRRNWNNYDEDLLQLSGNGWLIFSHVFPLMNEQWNEELYMIKTLSENGYTILEKREYRGSAVYKVGNNIE